jgi:hypothetical protein
MDVREQAEIHLALIQTCSSNLCNKYKQNAENLVDQFEACFAKVPKCRDLGALRHEFFEISKPLNKTASIVPALLRKIPNPRDIEERLLQMYHCSQNLECTLGAVGENVTFDDNFQDNTSRRSSTLLERPVYPETFLESLSQMAITLLKTLVS